MTTRTARKTHVFARWKSIALRLSGAAHLVIFLDFDGTLVPLRPQPDRARLGVPARRILGRLARIPGTTVYIMSGRRLADLRKRARVRGVRLIGLHGWERENPAPHYARLKRLLRPVKKLLARDLRHLPGIQIEDKGAALAVAYRGAPPDAVRSARPLLWSAARRFRRRVYVMEGKSVWEILPHPIKGKGDAALALRKELRVPALALYVGDDKSDETAFAALRGDVTVRVGPPGATAGRFRLRNPKEVLAFLRRMETERRKAKLHPKN